MKSLSCVQSITSKLFFCFQNTQSRAIVPKAIHYIVFATIFFIQELYAQWSIGLRGNLAVIFY